MQVAIKVCYNPDPKHACLFQGLASNLFKPQDKMTIMLTNPLKGWYSKSKRLKLASTNMKSAK